MVNQPEIYWGCTFSMNKKTTREIRKINIAKDRLYIPELILSNDIPKDFPDNQTLLDDARSLLYHVNVDEEEWEVDYTNNPTDYHVAYNQHSGLPMLCDRFDDKSFWFIIMTVQYEVIAIQRMIASRLIDHPFDLDMLSYANCPPAILEWIKQNKRTVGEADRAVTLKGHRRKKLRGYIMYMLSAYMRNPEHWGTDPITLTTIREDKTNGKLLEMMQCPKVPEWSFKYDDNDMYSVNVHICDDEVSTPVIEKYFKFYAKL